jgi:hypothetical protein
LLADARVTPCRSSRPPSSEDEPATRLAPAGNRVAADYREIRILRPLPPSAESEPARDAGAAPKADGRIKRCGSSPPLSSVRSMEDALATTQPVEGAALMRR